VKEIVDNHHLGQWARFSCSYASFLSITVASSAVQPAGLGSWKKDRGPRAASRAQPTTPVTFAAQR
jgi:hypothetical protein